MLLVVVIEVVIEVLVVGDNPDRKPSSAKYVPPIAATATITITITNSTLEIALRQPLHRGEAMELNRRPMVNIIATTLFNYR